MGDKNKVLVVEQNGVEIEYHEEIDLSAVNTEFDNSVNGFVSDDVQGAIEELSNQVGVSASPGFTWGRASNVNSGTWLLNDSVPSNKAGRTVNLINPILTAVSVAVEDIATFDITFYEHDGDSINLVSLGTISVTAARSYNAFINFPVTQGKQIAVRVTSGSCKNIVVGLQLSGEVA